MDQFNTTAACVLGLLEMGPIPGTSRDAGPDAMTGWQISETAAASLSRFWHVTRSQIYAELARLGDSPTCGMRRLGWPIAIAIGGNSGHVRVLWKRSTWRACGRSCGHFVRASRASDMRMRSMVQPRRRQGPSRWPMSRLEQKAGMIATTTQPQGLMAT